MEDIRQRTLDKAATFPKTSKKMAFDIINKIIDSNEFFFNKTIDSHEFNINENDIAQLYSFFTPAISKLKVKTDYEFCSIAAEKQGARDYLTKIYSNGKLLIGTDGSRLHWVDGLELKESYYNNEGNAITFDANYPDINRIIPEEGQNQKEININDCKIEFSLNNIKVINLFGDTWFNLSYVLQALQGVKNITAHNCLDRESIMFKNINGTQRNALIMPVTK